MVFLTYSSIKHVTPVFQPVLVTVTSHPIKSSSSNEKPASLKLEVITFAMTLAVQLRIKHVQHK